MKDDHLRIGTDPSAIRNPRALVLLVSLLLLLCVWPGTRWFHGEAAGTRSQRTADDSIKASVEQEPGVYRAIFNAPGVGAIFVNVPDDMAPGDIITGTVFVEPEGKDDQRAKNLGTLQKLSVEVDGKSIALSEPTFQLPIGADAKGAPMTVSLLDDKKKALVAQNIPTLAQAPAGTPAVSLPGYGKIGGIFPVKCPCDGVFARTDYLKIGGKETLMLAESPRQRVILNTSDVIGPTQIEMNEHGRVTTGEFRNVRLKMTASKLNLRKGEQATMHVEVAGLENLKEELPLRIENRSPSVLTLGGGNEQSITIRPSDVNRGGLYKADRGITGITPGSFRIEGIVRWINPETSAIANLVTPSAAAPSPLVTPIKDPTPPPSPSTPTPSATPKNDSTPPPPPPTPTSWPPSPSPSPSPSPVHEDCEGFDDGTNGGFSSSNAMLTVEPWGGPRGAGDSFLRTNDEAGPSFVLGPTWMLGNYSRFSGCYSICFDVQLFNDGDEQAHNQLKPWVKISNGSVSAKFIAYQSSAITEPGGANPGWHRVCAQLGPLQNGRPPNSQDGNWTISNPQDWPKLLANVTEVQFAAFDVTSQPRETAGYDNICMSSACPSSTNKDLRNGTGQTADGVLIAIDGEFNTIDWHYDGTGQKSKFSFRPIGTTTYLSWTDITPPIAPGQQFHPGFRVFGATRITRISWTKSGRVIGDGQQLDSHLHFESDRPILVVTNNSDPRIDRYINNVSVEWFDHEVALELLNASSNRQPIRTDVIQTNPIRIRPCESVNLEFRMAPPANATHGMLRYTVSALPGGPGETVDFVGFVRLPAGRPPK